jgi:hypothetical protein
MARTSPWHAFNSNGTLDASFGTAGEVASRLGTSPNSVARGLAIQPDGKILSPALPGRATARSCPGPL